MIAPRNPTKLFVSRPRAVRHVVAAIVAGGAVALFGLVGCASEPTVCNRTDGCVCPETGSDCSLACSGKGCEFTCPRNKQCTFDCPDGSCKAIGESKTAFDLTCAAGQCSVVCDGLVYTSGPDTEEINCDFDCACR